MSSQASTAIARWDEIRRQLPTVNLVIKGHPLHAILTDLPAALIPTGFSLSLCGRLARECNLESAGYATTVVGVISAVPTAVTGLADYLQMDVTDPAQRTGVLHGMLNTVALGLTVSSLKGRRLRRRVSRRSLWLSGLAVAVLGLSAYLGGDLVYNRGWRVRPVERAELESRGLPPTVHPKDLLVRPGARETVPAGPID